MPSPCFPLSGLADEAADSIHGQIQAHRALRWERIELRLIDGLQASTPALSDDAFERAMQALEEQGLQVNAFASAIGNWSRPIQGDFETDLQDLRLLLRRMKRSGARFVRTMSWVRNDAPLTFWRDEAVRRYQHMAALAADSDILLLHENCEGWGGLSPEHTVEFLERVNRTNVGVLFDIGNTVAHGLDPWEYYTRVKPLIRYVHIKDCKRAPGNAASNQFTMVAEGDAQVARILADLLASGYQAGASIEPHIASIIHLGSDAKTASPEDRMASYLEYARRTEALLESLANPAPPAPPHPAR
jgi:sugar phosphate isomerase/epimerase